MYRSNYSFATNRKNYLLRFLTIVLCFVMGQAYAKKPLTPADYHLWSSLEISNVSNKGKWISYYIRYQSNQDTLFVRSADGKKIYSYPLGSSGKFCGEQWHAAKLDMGSLALTHLGKGGRESFAGVSDFEFSQNCNYLFMFSKAKDGRSTVSIRDLTNGKVSAIENVTSWRFNKSRSMLTYCLANGRDGEVIVIAIADGILPVAQFQLPGSLGTYIAWQDSSASLVLVLQPVNESKEFDLLNTGLALYRFNEKQLLFLQAKKTAGFPKDKHVEAFAAGRLKISDDGKRIFFPLLPDKPSRSFDSPVVEVWQGDDKLLYSEQEQFGDFSDWAKSAVWYPDTNEVLEFMPNETHIKLSGDQQFALTSSMEPCELQFRYSPDRDYYLTNLTTGQRKLWLKCHSPELHHTLMSPSGKYIAYFKDGDWYSYAIHTGEHKNLTQELGVAFYDETNDIGDKPDAYGFGGWVSNDSSIVVYDKFDLWKIDLDGTGSKKITKGRDQQIAYRITKTKSAEEPFEAIHPDEVIDLKASLVLKAFSPDNSMQGYYIWENGKEEPLQFSSHRVYSLKKAEAADTYVFLQEDYEHPPSMQISNRMNTKTLFRSNPQQSEYRWGKVARISYTGATGAQLKGLLYYPADYIKGMKYPMIVRVYQKQSPGINNYPNPSEGTADGFSVINFVTKGYFVLLPDIDYVMNDPSDSAVFCTTAAVNDVLLRGDVDPKRIGLIGHSFGGYETSYIITKSNLFAAAVAGAALTDLVSEYLTVSENYKKAEFWRYEYFTNRMTKPLFDNFAGYLNNSPVYNAPNIQTPLLLWTGEKDTHVASTQSTELYLAMRRLGKKVTMLRYPEEDHSLQNQDAQSDLTNKVMDWFDYYLKDGASKQWMENPHGKPSK